MNNQRFGMLFDTSANMHYYYDSGNGKVIICNDGEKKLIEKILNNEISVEEAGDLNPDFSEFIIKEKLFACPEKRSFIFPDKQEFIKIIEDSCEQIILELTEKCNLRCGYCIYNEHHPEYRSFGHKNMSFEVAQKSIDSVLRNCKRKDFSLTFYGGEPLINFDVMRQCIDYTIKKYPEIKLHIAFTTNLTLLTYTMVEYFSGLNQDIDIMCSLDGPRQFHDKYRCYINGEGSFEKAIQNFKLLQEKFYNKENGKTLSINCVMTPPYSEENMGSIEKFFYEELKLPLDIKCHFAYLDKGNMVFDFEDDEIIVDNDERLLESSPLEEWAVDNLIEDRNTLQYFDIVSSDMGRVAKRMKSDNDIINATYLHGNCVPGQRRIYITVDGEFKVCEKVGDSPVLGDCNSGYDYDKVYKMYIEDYANYFEKICNNCWARPMCAICYERTMGKDGLKSGIEKSVCDGSRRIIKDMFVNYYRLFEKDESTLAESLKKYELK